MPPLNEEAPDTEVPAAPAPEAAPPPEPASEPAPPPAPKTLREELVAQLDKGTEPPEPKVEAKVKEETPPGEKPATEAPKVERGIPKRLAEAGLTEKWSTLPEDVKAQFHEYETHIGRINNKYGKAAQQWENVSRAYAPYEEMVRREGGDMVGAMSSLFETARLLRQGTPEQKRHLVQAIAEQFNIPLSETPAAASPSPSPSGVSPELASKIAELERRVLTREAEETYTVRNQVEQDLQAFIAEPQNVYVKEPGFLDTMAELIASKRSPDLQSAYESAAWLHPTTRALEIAKANLPRFQENAAAVARAKIAGASVNGNAPGAVRRDTSSLSLRETLSAAMSGELDS